MCLCGLQEALREAAEAEQRAKTEQAAAAQAASDLERIRQVNAILNPLNPRPHTSPVSSAPPT